MHIKKHLTSLFFEFIIPPLLADFFGVGTELLADGGFITWNLIYILSMSPSNQAIVSSRFLIK